LQTIAAPFFFCLSGIVVTRPASKIDPRIIYQFLSVSFSPEGNSALAVAFFTRYRIAFTGIQHHDSSIVSVEIT